MSDDFIKQLQENAVDKVIYESQQEEIASKQKEEYFKAKEKCRIELYKEIIEKTKTACLEAVKQGNYVMAGAEKKIDGEIIFYYSYGEYYDSIGIRCYIQKQIYFDIDCPKMLKKEDILFMIFERIEVDNTSIFNKLIKKYKTHWVEKKETDIENIKTFIRLFETSIFNSKISVASVLDCDLRSSHSNRTFKFEILF